VIYVCRAGNRVYMPGHIPMTDKQITRLTAKPLIRVIVRNIIIALKRSAWPTDGGTVPL
jgi:hypothetical protein